MEGEGVRMKGVCRGGTPEPKEQLMLLATDSSLLSSASGLHSEKVKHGSGSWHP